MEPSSLLIGWWPAGLRSMIDRRRNPRPTPDRSSLELGGGEVAPIEAGDTLQPVRQRRIGTDSVERNLTVILTDGGLLELQVRVARVVLLQTGKEIGQRLDQQTGQTIPLDEMPDGIGPHAV